jgi:hypothetical protein
MKNSTWFSSIFDGMWIPDNQQITDYGIRYKSNRLSNGKMQITGKIWLNVVGRRKPYKLVIYRSAVGKDIDREVERAKFKHIKEIGKRAINRFLQVRESKGLKNYYPDIIIVDCSAGSSNTLSPEVAPGSVNN